MDKFDLEVSSLLKVTMLQVIDVLESSDAAMLLFVFEELPVGCPQSNNMSAERGAVQDGATCLTQ
jgi:hypothetical protein